MELQRTLAGRIGWPALLATTSALPTIVLAVRAREPHASVAGALLPTLAIAAVGLALIWIAAPADERRRTAIALATMMAVIPVALFLVLLAGTEFCRRYRDFGVLRATARPFNAALIIYLAATTALLSRRTPRLGRWSLALLPAAVVCLLLLKAADPTCIGDE